VQWLKAKNFCRATSRFDLSKFLQQMELPSEPPENGASSCSLLQLLTDTPITMHEMEELFLQGELINPAQSSSHLVDKSNSQDLHVEGTEGVHVEGTEGVHVEGTGVHVEGTEGVHVEGTEGLHVEGTEGLHVEGTEGVHVEGTEGLHVEGTEGVHVEGTEGLHVEGTEGVHVEGAEGLHVEGTEGVHVEGTVVLEVPDNPAQSGQQPQDFGHQGLKTIRSWPQCHARNVDLDADTPDNIWPRVECPVKSDKVVLQPRLSEESNEIIQIVIDDEDDDDLEKSTKSEKTPFRALENLGVSISSNKPRKGIQYVCHLDSSHLITESRIKQHFDRNHQNYELYGSFDEIKKELIKFNNERFGLPSKESTTKKSTSAERAGNDYWCHLDPTHLIKQSRFADHFKHFHKDKLQSEGRKSLIMATKKFTKDRLNAERKKETSKMHLTKGVENPKDDADAAEENCSSDIICPKCDLPQKSSLFSHLTHWHEMSVEEAKESIKDIKTANVSNYVLQSWKSKSSTSHCSQYTPDDEKDNLVPSLEDFEDFLKNFPGGRLAQSTRAQARRAISKIMSITGVSSLVDIIREKHRSRINEFLTSKSQSCSDGTKTYVEGLKRFGVYLKSSFSKFVSTAQLTKDLESFLFICKGYGKSRLQDKKLAESRRRYALDKSRLTVSELKTVLDVVDFFFAAAESKPTGSREQMIFIGLYFLFGKGNFHRADAVSNAKMEQFFEWKGQLDIDPQAMFEILNHKTDKLGVIQVSVIDIKEILLEYGNNRVANGAVAADYFFDYGQLQNIGLHSFSTYLRKSRETFPILNDLKTVNVRTYRHFFTTKGGELLSEEEQDLMHRRMLHSKATAKQSYLATTVLIAKKGEEVARNLYDLAISQQASDAQQAKEAKKRGPGGQQASDAQQAKEAKKAKKRGPGGQQASDAQQAKEAKKAKKRGPGGQQAKKRGPGGQQSSDAQQAKKRGPGSQQSSDAQQAKKRGPGSQQSSDAQQAKKAKKRGPGGQQSSDAQQAKKAKKRGPGGQQSSDAQQAKKTKKRGPGGQQSSDAQQASVAQQASDAQQSESVNQHSPKHNSQRKSKTIAFSLLSELAG
ncbi:hypothetical protein BOX15_Mlig000354g1, partial [Macrostomum lignano]